jgi:Flp pilus assembly protein TadB
MNTAIVLITAVAAAAIAVAYWADHVRTERERNERARATPRGTVRAKRPSQGWLYWP